MTGRSAQTRGGSTGRFLVCVGTAAAGAFAVAGCLLALRLEADGFGRPRDTGLRPGYVISLIGGTAAGVIVPTVVCRWLLDGRRRWLYVVASGAALIVAVAVLGVVA